MLLRRTFSIGALGLGLALPGRAGAQVADDVTIGGADAPLHLIEYASTTCPHCADFHNANWYQLRVAYIQTGRVRYTMREMLTPPPAVALGMFQLARANRADATEYFRRVAILFERQRTILGTGSMAGVRDALLALGAEWGLSEAQVMAALSDTSGQERILRSADAAQARGVDHTPYFILNGQVMDHGFLAPGGMVQALNAALG